MQPMVDAKAEPAFVLAPVYGAVCDSFCDPQHTRSRDREDQGAVDECMRRQGGNPIFATDFGVLVLRRREEIRLESIITERMTREQQKKKGSGIVSDRHHGQLGSWDTANGVSVSGANKGSEAKLKE
jgi:hypothetical protein